MKETIEEKLKANGWKCDRAKTVAAAMDLFADNEYDCIIIDLSVDPLGLTPDEINDYHPYFGWAWVHKYLQAEGSDVLAKSIVFSQYVKDLKNSKWASEIKRLKIEPIPKGKDDSLEQLMARVKKIVDKKA